MSFKQGDFVRHKTRILNGGIPMTVIEVGGQHAKCSFICGSEGDHKEEWFSFDELVVVKYG